MKKITIKFPDNTSIEVENQIRPLTLMKHFGDNGQKIMAVKVNNELQPLDSEIDINATLEPVYKNTKDGAAIYRRSLCFELTENLDVFPLSNGPSIGESRIPLLSSA